MLKWLPFLRALSYRLEILKKLSPFARGVRKYFILIGMIGGISMASSLILPVFYRLFVDRVIIGREVRLFATVAAGYFGLFLLNTLLSFLRNYAGNRLLHRTIFRIKHRILCNYLSFPFHEYEKRSTGDLKMRIEDDASKLADFGGAQTVEYLKSLITAVVAAILILTVEWRLALFSILVIPLTFYLDHKISLKEKELNDINRGNDQRCSSWLQASIQGWKEVKALNLQKRQMRIFVRYVHNFAEFFGRWINCWVARVLVIPKIKDEFLMKFALYFFGGLLIMRGEMTIGTLLVFAMYYSLLSGNILAVSAADAELQSNRPLYDRALQELGSGKHAALGTEIPENESRDINDICMRNVAFSYDRSLPPVVEHLSLEIKRGERVAITGRSGSGKTTVLKIMTGMLSPDEGLVLFSGTDISKINTHFLYGKIGFVLQENMLFNISIRENLRLACPGASEIRLEEACRKACIDEFIHTLPGGYDTIIGEKGIKLSGGQRQRLVLARLFLREVDVMIFDEATSSLDQYSESIVHDAIHAAGRDRTVIIVAHRESSIALCDRVIKLG
jgi:ABC-type bacteriocin/lantibiotic exporter with double-glycine peptidase domain